MTTKELITAEEPHPHYGQCDGMGFEDGACSECERMSPSPEEYKARQSVHSWKVFKRELSDGFLRHYLRLPYGSSERAECRRMIDALSEIHQAGESQGEESGTEATAAALPHRLDRT